MFFQTSCAHAWVIHYTTTVLRTGGTPVYILSAVESPPAIWNYVARNEVGMDSLRLLMEAAGYGCPLSCSPSTEHFAYWRCRAKSNRRILKCCGPNIITNFWITFLFNTCICYKVSTSNGVRSIQVQGVPEYVGKVEFEIKKKCNIRSCNFSPQNFFCEMWYIKTISYTGWYNLMKFWSIFLNLEVL